MCEQERCGRGGRVRISARSRWKVIATSPASVLPSSPSGRSPSNGTLVLSPYSFPYSFSPLFMYFSPEVCSWISSGIYIYCNGLTGKFANSRLWICRDGYSIFGSSVRGPRKLMADTFFAQYRPKVQSCVTLDFFWVFEKNSVHPQGTVNAITPGVLRCNE